MCREALYNPVLGGSCNVTNVYNMSAKNNSDNEYYGRKNSDSEYYGRDFVTQNKK